MDKDSCLLVAKTKVLKGFERPFNDWYSSHLPKRLRAPGFSWGFRFQSAHGDSSYLALYEIKNTSYLNSLLNIDISERHPILASPAFNEPPIGLEKAEIGVYRLAHSEPKEGRFLSEDNLITTETWDWSAEGDKKVLSRQCDELYLAEALNYPEYTAAWRFERLIHPDIDYTNRMPRNFAIFEHSDILESSLLDAPKLSSKAKALFHNHSIETFEPLSKHWASGKKRAS